MDSNDNERPDAKASDTAAVAKRLLGHQVKLGKTIRLPEGRIEVWRSARRRPGTRVSLYVSQSGEILRVDASWDAFEAVLKRSRPDLGQLRLLIELISCAPGRRLVATEKFRVPEAYRSTDWHPTRGKRGEWNIHCVETIGGRWERVVITSDYSVTLEDIGPAPLILLR